MSQAQLPVLSRLSGLLKHRPFYIHIGTIFVLLNLVILLTVGWVTQLETRKMVRQSADQLFDHIGNEVAQDVRLLRSPVEMAVQFGASLHNLTDAVSLAQRMEQVHVLTHLLREQPQVAAVYYAYPDGDFFLVRPLREAVARDRFKAPAQAAYLVQSAEQGGTHHRWVALADDLSEVMQWAPADNPLDARTRPWYALALGTDKLVRTAPYAFASTGQFGRTVALKASKSGVVVGADILTDTLSAALERYRMTDSTELAIVDAQNGLLASHVVAKAYSQNSAGQPAMARLEQLSPVMAALGADLNFYRTSHIIQVDGRDWTVRVTPLLTQASHDYLALATPVDELMSEVNATQRLLLSFLLAAMVLALPVVWWVAKRIADQLDSLTQQAAAIKRFDFQTDVPLQTSIREIHGLGQVMGQMKTTIQKFLQVSTALAAERNFDVLLDRVLQEVRLAADSDGGVIYLVDEEQGVLKLAAQRWVDGTEGVNVVPTSVALTDVAHPVAASANNAVAPGKVTIDVPRPGGLDYLNTRYGQQSVDMIALPLLGRTGNVVGVVCNFIAPGKPAPSPERMALAEAFAGAAAAAIDQQRLMRAQKLLLNAIIGLVAGAIDAKSPYTGGHCQRVPELTEMLAKAAQQSEDAPFADFNPDEDEWEAIHIAAWLHDCGKVTTPEYVVDKATKLETIYNRIHEVRMRFEVIKRDREIATLKAIAAGGDSAALNTELQRSLQSLDEDFQFLATCNEGGEFISAERLERIRAIAGHTWMRTLDDRIGLSADERGRLGNTAPSPLPATEPLLADKPEHIVERGPGDVMPQDNPWGFQLTMPENLYNRGEIYNLSIARGTLTDEERYKINHHITQTILMLSQLPFPQHLKSVVEIAGGHHEKMDGTGYPKRLLRDQMSVPARIMAIADIFEALTATDRPYKPGKKLSEAIKIMGFMVKDKHIDPDLFKLFLKSGVYRAYAEKYLKPEFIDDVNLAPYLEV